MADPRIKKYQATKAEIQDCLMLPTRKAICLQLWMCDNACAMRWLRKLIKKYKVRLPKRLKEKPKVKKKYAVKKLSKSEIAINEAFRIANWPHYWGSAGSLEKRFTEVK